MYANFNSLRAIEKRSNRLLIGRLLFRLHIAFALVGTGIAALIWAGEGLRASASLRFTGASFMSVVYLFAFTLGIHITIRWMNQTAERLRRREMLQEWENAGYYGEPITPAKRKSKRNPQTYVRLSDDGELVFREDELTTKRKRN